MKRPVQNHCTDEQLLGHLDGELSRRLEYSVGRHLKCCWECRRRMNELEEQIRSVSRLLGNAESIRLRSHRARERFGLWQSSFEKERARVPH
jgi:anti-sigma factor RsiW